MTLLADGSNAPLTGDRVSVEVSGDVDLTALVVNADGRVSGDADMVFFNQPVAPGVRLDGRVLALDLASLRPGADRVVLVASPRRDGASFAGLPVTLTVEHGGPAVQVSPSRLRDETVAVLAEVYRRGGSWKLRAVGQGYANGLAGLATDFGVDVDDDAPPAAPAPAAISFTKGEEHLPPEMRSALNLRKQARRLVLRQHDGHLLLAEVQGAAHLRRQVAVVLTKHQATGLRCRVVLVLDVSGSTSSLYRKGVFARAVERVAPVAAQVDDGAEMQAWAMGAEARRLDDITIATLPQWIQEYAKARFTGAGGWNNEAATIDDVARYVREDPLDVPTLVLFFHDGGVTDNKGTERAVRAVEDEPIFWQFIGLGRSNYGILQRLDTLTDRRHDNTGFFALDDIDQVPDAELYERLLAEFPSWMRSYYPATHPAVRSLG